MSRLTNKNLHYDKTLPPFLARMRGQAAADESDGPSALLALNRQHGRPRSGSAQAEDAPVVLDEEGNEMRGVQVGLDGTVQEREGEDKSEGDANNTEAPDGKAGGEKDAPREGKDGEEKLGAIGGGRKRKAGRVIGPGEDTAEDALTTKSSTGKVRSKQDDADTKGDGAKGTAKPKKKAKKIKLSFGDDEG